MPDSLPRFSRRLPVKPLLLRSVGWRLLLALLLALPLLWLWRWALRAGA